MRFVLNIGGPLPFLVYREKLRTAIEILKLLLQYDFLNDLHLDWIIFRGLPRSSISPTARYVVMIREELISRRKIVNLELNDIVEEASKSLNRLWYYSEPEKRPLMRDSEIVIGFKAKFFDLPITGTIHIRGTGWMKRIYGDIEIITYYAAKKLEDMAKLYKYIASEYDEEIAKRFNNIASIILYRESGIVKNIYVQPIDTDITRDYDQMYAIAHRDPRTHFALVMRYMRKKREDIIHRKIRHRISDAEIVVYRKLSTYLNYSTLYNKVAQKLEFINATIKAYEAANMLATSGSLIIASRTGEPLEKAYMSYLEKVLEPFVSDFPEREMFDEWIKKGLKRLSSLYR